MENQPAAGNVLANDINLRRAARSRSPISSRWTPSIGTLTIETNGDLMFTPAVDWTGFVSTTYTVANGSHEKDGNILITVTPLNEEPTATDDTVTVDEDTPTDVTAQLLANDTDPDTDTLVVSAVSNACGGIVQLQRPTWSPSRPMPTTVRHRRRKLRLRHQRWQWRQRQRERDGRRHLLQ